MNILLLNNNPVVSRLVSFCIRDTDAVFEEVSAIGSIAGTEYDIVFVDDASYDNEVAAYLSAMPIATIVFFSSRDSGEEIGRGFDTVIKKPFLPSQIRQVIDRVEREKNLQSDKEKSIPLEHGSTDEEERLSDVPFIFPLSDEKKEETEENSDTLEETDNEKEVPNVLDQGEIAQIKALLEEEDEKIEPLDPFDEDAYEARKIEAITKKLEEDGLEIVREEEILSELSQKPKKKQKKLKAKKKQKKRKKKEETYTMEEALLAAIENMKPKKIKKLLKGADVTIKIRFKDDL